MDRMLVIVFDTESKAYEGKEALLALDDDGRISVYACVVISKNADGSTEVEQTLDSVPVETLVGTSLVLEDMASAMGLLVLGFPLTPATISATLLGWILVVVSITRFRFGHSQIAQTCTPKLCHKESTRG